MRSAWPLVGGLRLQEESPNRGFAGRTTPRRKRGNTYHRSFVQEVGGAVVKTLAIRLEDDQHAQLTVVASLGDLTITDAIRQAIDEWIKSRKSQPELTAKAQSMLDEIERDAAQRREAIATLFGGDAAGAEAKTSEEGESPGSRRSPRGKGGTSAES